MYIQAFSNFKQAVNLQTSTQPYKKTKGKQTLRSDKTDRNTILRNKANTDFEKHRNKLLREERDHMKQSLLEKGSKLKEEYTDPGYIKAQLYDELAHYLKELCYNLPLSIMGEVNAYDELNNDDYKVYKERLENLSTTYLPSWPTNIDMNAIFESLKLGN